MRTRWSPTVWWLFDACFRPFMRRRLGGVYLAGLPEILPAETAIIMVANHVSWWDGFLLREVHRRCAGQAPMYTIMLDEQLTRFPVFRWMGAFGIEPGEVRSLRQAVRFLQARLLEGGTFWLAFFPQGRIWPSWRRPLGFQPGLRFFARILTPAMILPVGLHLEPLTHPGPTAFVWVGAPLSISAAHLDVDEVEGRVGDAVDRILGLLREHGEAAPQQWPGLRIL